MLVQEKSTNKENSSNSESNDSEDSESDEGTQSHYMNHDDEQMKIIIPNKETNNNSSYQTTEVPPEESIGETGRLFVRNLPYICTEDDLRKEFVKFGPLAEVSN